MLHWVATVLPMIACVVAPAIALTMLSAHGYVPAAGDDNVDPASFALWVCIAAELMTNAHTFIIVACNHAGDDLYRFSTACKGGSAEFLLRCSYAGVNFETGTDFIDIMYGWLNYQIEHHMYPDMTHLQYRKLQPLVSAAALMDARYTASFLDPPYANSSYVCCCPCRSRRYARSTECCIFRRMR